MAVIKTEPSRKFQRIYKDDDGCESIWNYDLDKFTHGPISVELKYSSSYDKVVSQARLKESIDAKGKLGELHAAFAKLDATRKKEKDKQISTKK